MGAEIDRETFDEADHARFRVRLRESLAALDLLLARSGFGRGPASIGAELELCVVDDAGLPLLGNERILERTSDDRITLELDRFNLEINASPCPLAGRPFSALGAELDAVLEQVRRAAAARGGRIVPVGILPTLAPEHVAPGAISDRSRYRALSAALRQMRGSPFEIRIDGDEPLTFACEAISLVGATTSFQVHLRVEPDAFARTFNAAQLATVVTLAASGNSPIFLGHRLWEETRVALFKQGSDPRAQAGDETPRPAPRTSFGQGWVRSGIVELFAESVALHPAILPVLSEEDPIACVRSGGTPRLAELRLHHGTVYPWTRGIYDPAGGGHLRIEFRALPAGPSTPDMLANAAFLVGLTLALAPDMDGLLPGIPFPYAAWSFYRAAQKGLDAELFWPSEDAPSPTLVAAPELALRLLPSARRGLAAAGVDAGEAERLLGIFEGRVRSRRTGARFQRATLSSLERRAPRSRALAGMLERYLEWSSSGVPVHEWPEAA